MIDFSIYGMVTPEIYSTIAIACMITYPISFIVIGVIKPITSVNATTYFSTTH